MIEASSDRPLNQLRSQVAALERVSETRAGSRILAFGEPTIDALLPGGGLALGALHEAAGAGPDTEHAAAATLWAAGLAARIEGDVLWVVSTRDLFSPGLAAVGLHPSRLLVTEAGKEMLLVMEEGLRHPGLGAVVGELSGRLSLTASRRLQLAAEQSGVTAIVLRRSRKFDDPALREPNAAVSRWRIRSLPSPPPLAHAPDTPGVGPPRWQLDLIRCRGGEAASWIVEGCDAQGYLHLAANLADRSSAAPPRRRAAGGQAFGDSAA
jgi:protein ImuA